MEDLKIVDAQSVGSPGDNENKELPERDLEHALIKV